MTLVMVPCIICGSRNFQILYPASPSCGAESNPAVSYTTSRTRAGHLQIVRCPECGLVMTNPRDDPATQARIYASMQDLGYEQEAESRRFTAREHLAWVEQHVVPPGRLLDIGCATGIFLEEAIKNRWQATGLEPSAWASQIARQRCPGADIRTASLETAAFQPRSFHVITLWDVLEHLSEPGQAFQRLHSWLIPGGWLFLNVPNAASLSARLAGSRWVLLLREHLWYFSPKTLGQLLQKSSFRQCDWRSNRVRFTPGGVFQRLAQYTRPGSLTGRALLRFSRLRAPVLRFPIGEMNVTARAEFNPQPEGRTV